MKSFSSPPPETDTETWHRSRPSTRNAPTPFTMASSPPLTSLEIPAVAQVHHVQKQKPFSQLLPKYRSLAERKLHEIRADQDAAMMEKRSNWIKPFEIMLPDSKSSIYKIQILERPRNPTLYTYDCAIDCISHHLSASDAQVIQTDIATYSFWIKLRDGIENPINLSHRDFQHAQDASAVTVITKVGGDGGFTLTGDSNMGWEM